MKFTQILALSLLVSGGGLSTALAGGQLGSQAGPGVFSSGQFAGQAGSAGAQDEAQTRGVDEDGYYSGAFNNSDQVNGAVWINDRLYWLHPDLRVIGNSTKMGLLSAIRPGEIVRYAMGPDPKYPNRQVIVEIRRE